MICTLRQSTPTLLHHTRKYIEMLYFGHIADDTLNYVLVTYPICVYPPCWAIPLLRTSSTPPGRKTEWPTRSVCLRVLEVVRVSISVFLHARLLQWKAIEYSSINWTKASANKNIYLVSYRSCKYHLMQMITFLFRIAPVNYNLLIWFTRKLQYGGSKVEQFRKRTFTLFKSR